MLRAARHAAARQRAEQKRRGSPRRRPIAKPSPQCGQIPRLEAFQGVRGSIWRPWRAARARSMASAALRSTARGFTIDILSSLSARPAVSARSVRRRAGVFLQPLTIRVSVDASPLVDSGARAPRTRGAPTRSRLRPYSNAARPGSVPARCQDRRRSTRPESQRPSPNTARMNGSVVGSQNSVSWALGITHQA